jgi:hypothetical protein
MRRIVLIALLLAFAPAAPAAAADSLNDRVEELQQEIDSLTEEVEDLREPVFEFDLFDQCMFTIGVSQHGTRDGARGFYYGRRGLRRWPALSLDMSGTGVPDFEFLAFPAEEPPSIECNEDAGEEITDEG